MTTSALRLQRQLHSPDSSSALKRRLGQQSAVADPQNDDDESDNMPAAKQPAKHGGVDSDEALQASFARQIRLKNANPLRLSLDSSVQLLHSANQSARELLFSGKYNITERCYARDASLDSLRCPRDFLVGLETFALALDRVIARPMTAPVLCRRDQAIIAVQAQPSSGATSLLDGWCANSNHRLNLVTYSSCNAPLECNGDFFVTLMRYCATSWPCVLAIDRISARAPADWALALYQALWAAYLRFFDKQPASGKTAPFYMVIIDQPHPDTFLCEWSFIKTTVILPLFDGAQRRNRLIQSIRHELCSRLLQRTEADELWQSAYDELAQQLAQQHADKLLTPREMSEYLRLAFEAPVDTMSLDELRTLSEQPVVAASILPNRTHFEQALAQVQANRLIDEQRAQQHKSRAQKLEARQDNERLWEKMETVARGDP